MVGGLEAERKSVFKYRNLILYEYTNETSINLTYDCWFNFVPCFNLGSFSFLSTKERLYVLRKRELNFYGKFFS